MQNYNCYNLLKCNIFKNILCFALWAFAHNVSITDAEISVRNNSWWNLLTKFEQSADIRRLLELIEVNCPSHVIFIHITMQIHTATWLFSEWSFADLLTANSWTPTMQHHFWTTLDTCLLFLWKERMNSKLLTVLTVSRQSLLYQYKWTVYCF